MKELIEKHIHSFQSQISSIEIQLSSSPDEALNSIKNLQEQINTAFSEAQIQAKQIQLEQLKKEAGELLNDTTDMLKHIHNPAMQQLIGPQLRQLQPQIKKVSELIQTDPQQAKSLSENLKRQLQEMLDKSQEQLLKDSQIKATANTALEQVKQQLEVYIAASSRGDDESVQQIRKLIDNATIQYQQGQYKQVEDSCHQAIELLKQASQKSFDETVRREVVQGLLTTFTNMGFVVQQPCLESDNESGKTVRLIGKLPSGKTASFNVHLDGKMDFDFDGYEGRACAKELEHIDQMLQQQQFSIKLSENQITWKNPDKIAKGAMQQLTGNRNINLC
jgi:DNA repair exonuclease SbcCD ATPase subunit